MSLRLFDMFFAMRNLVLLLVCAPLVAVGLGLGHQIGHASWPPPHNGETVQPRQWGSRIQPVGRSELEEGDGGNGGKRSVTGRVRLAQGWRGRGRERMRALHRNRNNKVTGIAGGEGQLQRAREGVFISTPGGVEIAGLCVPYSPFLWGGPDHVGRPCYDGDGDRSHREADSPDAHPRITPAG